MVYAVLIIFLFAAAFVGLGGLILVEVMHSRSERRWLNRVSR